MKRILLIWFLGIMMVACTEDEDISPAITHRIIAISSSTGIGDQGYVDKIFAGYERVYSSLAPSTYMQICTPRSLDEAYEMSLRTLEKAKDGVPTLVIFGNVEYKSLVDSLRIQESLSGSNVSILLFEADSLAPALNDLNYYSFIFSSYGASYEAGKYVAETGFEHPLIWLSNPVDKTLDGFREGFTDGYSDVKGRRPDVRSLADDWRGYNMSDSAYRAMPALSKEYDFIFPVMGGSNLGIFRYLREHPEGPYVAGMDVDQGRYANRILGSIIKNIDQVIVDFIESWMAGEEIPSHSVFDTSSGYVEWHITK